MTSQSDIQSIAVFDFDGTVLDGHSPVMLVTTLFFSHAMPVRTGLAIGWWGLRYKLRLPHEQEGVRNRIFGLFAGNEAAELDRMLARFYTDVISKRVRADARREIDCYRHRGIPVILASASFEAIVRCAAEDLGASGQISTKMEIVDGKYTGEVKGEPVQGLGKRDAFIRYANDRCGEGNWRIVAAYGDHYSDEPLLEMADNPVAVNPDNKLQRIAKTRGWEIREWV